MSDEELQDCWDSTDDVWKFTFLPPEPMMETSYPNPDGSTEMLYWEIELLYPEPGNRFFMREDDDGKYSLSATVSRSIPPPQ